MLFKHKNKLKVDLGDLLEEKDRLSSFLRSGLKVEVTSSGNELVLDTEKLSPQELKALVTKFIYHRNLNNTFWVGLEGSIVKINKFKGVKKPEKRKKEGTSPSMISHGW